MSAEGDVNNPYWPGPSAAGQGRATSPTPTAEDVNGYAGGVYVGRSAAGVSNNQIGPNAAGQEKEVAQP